MKRLLIALLTLVAVGLVPGGHAGAAGGIERLDLDRHFQGYTGTFVLYDEAADRYLIYNEPQSRQPLSPCSTFKIYNSLIGLETGVLDQEDVYTLIKWNGTQYSLPAWNRDQTLASATRDSVVWYYQELAGRVGVERMQAYLDKFAYGNRDISGGLTTFWLGSSLKISAREQVDLLHSLYTGRLPVATENVAIVARNITLSEQDGLRLMGKTGSGLDNGKWTLGWFVGCVEKQGSRYYFAVNIQAADGASGGKARDIAKAVLRDLSIL